MRNKISRLITVLLITAIVLGLGPTIRASPPSSPAFYVVPDTETFTPSDATIGTLFNVTVWAEAPNGTDAWSVQASFDPTQLQAVSATFAAGPTSSLFAAHAANVTGPTPIIDNVGGSVFIGEVLLGVDYIPATTATVFTVTFNITLAPAPSQTLSSSIDPGYGLSQGETFFLLQSPSAQYPSGSVDSPNTAPCAYSFSSGVTPPTRHDVAVASVTPASASVNQGDSLSISVVALNNGTVTETFDVNVTYDGTLIGKQTVTSLVAGTTQSLSFSWNTIGVAAGNYTLTATAVPVAGETDLSNNAKTAKVQVTEPTHKPNPYDINGDGKVDIIDIHIAALAFGTRPGDPRWNPDADVNGDGEVNIMDIALVAQQFGKLA